MNISDQPGAGKDPLAFLAGGGETGALIRAFDWSHTPLGPAEQWPQSLRSALSIGLNSNFPIALYWGSDLVLLYNDDWSPIPGEKHPWVLGRPAREAWPEIWHIIEPLFRHVLATGEPTRQRDQLLPMKRHGFTEECYFDYTFSPVRGEGGRVEGVFNAVVETTNRVVGERRLRTLRVLSAWEAGVVKSAEDACRTAARTLAENPHDLPFALLYLQDKDGKWVALAGHAGVGRDTPVSPATVDLDAPDAPWPFRRVAESGKAVEVDIQTDRFGPLPGGAWPEPPQRAVVLPLSRPGKSQLAGFVVAGVSPRLALNDEYRGFLDLLTGHVATAIANARAYEEEKRRAEALAEIDRAKTTFFSNVSHEFRTPLTLMLGPVEDLLAHGHPDLTPAAAAQLQVVNRNGQRLLRLVNSLLDFSRIEAGRVRAAFQPTDLAAFTADLASNFRSACERAGLRLVVNCPPLGEPVLVDREMWEKVVLNLLSNAFKFTFEGEIAVTLRRAGTAAELAVCDTGTGIPPEEMLRLFERFHRIQNARGRTHEGSGIGLALVQELVKLHGGTITAESGVGAGTTFTVSLPLGSAHLPPDQIGEGRTAAPTETGAAPYVEEAMRWLPGDGPGENGPELWTGQDPPLTRPQSNRGSGDVPRVLVADDNPDMRQYVARLLADHYRVEVVPDGAAALAAIRDRSPDLILTDVMMPRLDGFGLLRELRADSRTREVPVILLSARAGEESRVEGMEAGADDYMVKPFSARELLARVTASLQLARLRREAGQSLRASEERLRTALTAARMVAWEWTPSDGKLRVSENAADVFGLPAGVGLTGIDQGLALLHPDDMAPYRATYQKAIDDRTGYLTRYRLVRPDDGRVIWIEERGHTVFDGPGGGVRLFGVAMDVTARHQAEADLARLHADAERERRLFDMALSNTTDFNFIFDLDGRFVYANRSLLALWGRTAGEAIGSSMAEIGYPPNVEAQLLGNIRRVVETGEAVRDETPYTSPTAATGYYEYTLAPVFSAGGAVVQIVGSARDIRDRKRTEEELRRLAAELRDAHRRKDEFLATLAHELRNPLAPIRNGLQVIRMAGANGTVEQARSMMDRQLTQLVRLVDDLLDVSRVTSGKLELRMGRLELRAVIDAAVETSRPAIEQAGHDLAVVIPDEPIFMDGDATRLAQVVSNLLNNSAKYTHKGGHVRLAVKCEDGTAVVSVADDGIGIPPAMLGRVFEMFIQVDRTLEKTTGGLGIGLSLVKGLVEKHGGTIEARSEGEGKGSEFIVRLPVVVTVSGEDANGRAGEVVPAGPRRILVVDDNVDAADSMGQLLEMLGNEVRTAHDGEAGIRAAEAFRPAVVLMDIGMPKMNGYEACRRIREQPWGKDMVLVALTGWGQEDDRQKSADAGFDHHLVKPVETAALMKLLAGLEATA